MGKQEEMRPDLPARPRQQCRACGRALLRLSKQSDLTSAWREVGDRCSLSRASDLPSRVSSTYVVCGERAAVTTSDYAENPMY